MKITVNPSNSVGRLSVRSGSIGPAGLQGTTGTQGVQGLLGVQGPAGTVAGGENFVSVQGSTMTGPLVIEFSGAEGLTVNADAQVVEDLTVGEVLRVGDFELSSNNFTTTGTGILVIDSFPASVYSTARYTIQITDSMGDIHATELFLMQSGTNIYVTEYATLLSGNQLGGFDVDLLAGNARLLFNLNNPGGEIHNIHVLRHALRI